MFTTNWYLNVHYQLVLKCKLGINLNMELLKLIDRLLITVIFLGNKFWGK